MPPPLTPIREDEKQQRCPGAPVKSEETQEDVSTVPPRRLGFEREVLGDDDDDTDSDDGELPPLDLPEVIFLHNQLKLINGRHEYLSSIIRNETKNVRAALRVIRRARRKAVELESQSWSINSILGRTDAVDYIGL